MCSSAFSGGQAASRLPSSKYAPATRPGFQMASTPATNVPKSCFSGRSNLFGKDGVRRLENPAQEAVRERPGDAVSEPARQNGAAVIFEIGNLLQISRS